MTLPVAAPAVGDAEVIIEIHRVGNAVKVSAIDPVSMTEVSIVAPVNCGKRQMKDAALRKLRYVMARSVWQRR